MPGGSDKGRSSYSRFPVAVFREGEGVYASKGVPSQHNSFDHFLST